MFGKVKELKKGFTLIELLVVISIIAVLMSIMMPALGRVKEQAKTVVCSNNLRQLSLAWTFYAEDNKGWLACAINRTFQYAWFADNKGGVPTYMPTGTRWGNAAEADEVYEGYYCPKNAKKLISVDSDYADSGTFGFGTGYHVSTEIGYDRHANVSKLKNAAAKPLMFCFFDAEAPTKLADGTPKYLGDYVSAAYDPAKNDNSGSIVEAYRFTYGATDVHGGLGTDFLMVDGHVERIKPLLKDNDDRTEIQEAYAKKFDWSAKGACKEFDRSLLLR